jgi:glycosyltransferase involved in cell wall biosynthesis
LAQELGVADSVRFTGFLDANGKATEADAADIYINTNRVDNMPVAVVEAMAFGLPVVTTAVGGIPDLLKHGDTGLFVPVNDEKAMVRAIQSLLKNPELAARLSANGRRLAERSSWDRVRQQWEELFATLTDRSTAKTREHPLAGSHRELAKGMASNRNGSMETL